MASLYSYQHYCFTTTTTLLVVLLHLILLCSVSCFNQPQPLNFHRGLLFEEKNRLGSIPPSCHNKCNQCHPCMAVQVPTLPSHQRGQPTLSRTASLGFSDPSHQANRYSNYKPLGWKCRCGDHFFNP